MRNAKEISFLGLLMLISMVANAQLQLQVQVVNERNQKPLPNVDVMLEPGLEEALTDKNGLAIFENLQAGPYKIIVSSTRFETLYETIQLNFENQKFVVEATDVAFEMESTNIEGEYNGAGYLRSVEGMAIYAAKKNELIHIDRLNANLAINNARQIFARVPGLNIWESDGGGLQLGIGGRGLSPNRTSNFNTRQNGYDIAADALGYPESYYSPPTEALERIEVVRGAASLQYGTQFGGMVNFVFKEGPKDRPFAYTSRQTVGSFGLLNSFHSFGGTVGKVNYYTFYQGKRGNGWRENAGFRQHTAYAAVSTQFSTRFRVGVEYTFMDYLAQQPGGLTDALFEQNPRQSIRERNWFQVNWNLMAVTADWAISDRTRLNIRNFGLVAGRTALGFLGSINRTDPGEARDIIDGDFRNFGNETRLLHKFEVGNRPAAFLLGTRYYQGNTQTRQGLGTAGSDADFTLQNPENPSQSRHKFPSRNISAFSELMLNITDKFTLAPGVRAEYIRTRSDGWYKQRVMDLAGNVIFEQSLNDSRELDRAFLLAGLGAGYRMNKKMEVYMNISQNYRAVNFNDLRIVNPNFRIDSTLADERGFNADLGFRGKIADWFDMDVSAFFLYYRNRIGQVLASDPVTFQYYRYRTNIANSRNIGLEWYGEANLYKLFNGTKPGTSVSIFSNFAWIDARYISSDEPAFDGNFVELVPPITLKSGVNMELGRWRGSWQWAYTAAHFSDATNAERSPNAVEGTIPAYTVMDISLGWEWKRISLESGINNLLNEQYFTRRAVGYPGPGIIPSDGRNFYLTLQVKL